MLRKFRAAIGARPRLPPAWRPVLRVADKHERSMEKAVAAVFNRCAADLDVDRLAAAIGSGDRARAVRIALDAVPEDTLDTLRSRADIPVARRCPACSGDGLPPERYMGDPRAQQPCPACGGTGRRTLQTAAGATNDRSLTDRLLDVMEDAGNATRCAVRPTPQRADRTLAAYRPAGLSVQLRHELHEGLVAAMLGAVPVLDSAPVDLLATVGRRRHGFDVRTLAQGEDVPVMHPRTRARKIAWAQRNAVTLHTVVVVEQSDGPAVYYRRGVGLALVGAMHVITNADQLRALIREERQ